MEHKLELRSSLKSNDDTSSSSECDLGALFSFFVAESFLIVIPPALNVLLHPSVEKIVVCRSSGSDAVEINVSSPCVLSVRESLLINSSKFGLCSVPWENFLLFRALNPISSKMSYFSNPPQRAVM